MKQSALHKHPRACALVIVLASLWTSGGVGADGPVLGAYFYGTMSDRHLLQLAERSFNAAFIKYSKQDLGPGDFDDMQSKAALGASLDIDVYPTVNAHNPLLLAGSQPERRFRSRRGQLYETVACPADTSYWQRLWTAVVLPAWQAGDGRLAIDLEIYGAEGLHHWPPEPCVCIPCLLEYTGYTEQNRALADAWLHRLGPRDLEDLAQWQRTRLAAWLTTALTEADVTQLAVLDLGRPGLVSRALALALERLDLPVMDLTELTYVEGSQVPEAELTHTYAGLDLDVRLVPGYWLLKWRPEALAADIRRLADQHAGYWIFTSYSLYVPPAELSGDYRLDGPQGAYWQELEQVNRELPR